MVYHLYMLLSLIPILLDIMYDVIDEGIMNRLQQMDGNIDI